MCSPLQLPLGTLVVEPCQGPAGSEPVPSPLVLLSQLEFTGVCWGLPWPSSPHPTAQGHFCAGGDPRKDWATSMETKACFQTAKRNCFYLRPLMSRTVQLLEKSNSKKALCCAVTAPALLLGLFFAKLTWASTLIYDAHF